MSLSKLNFYIRTTSLIRLEIDIQQIVKWLQNAALFQFLSCAMNLMEPNKPSIYHLD